MISGEVVEFQENQDTSWQSMQATGVLKGTMVTFPTPGCYWTANQLWMSL